MEQKAFTVRLDPDQAADLEAAAAADGISIAEAIRQAVTERIEARRQDPVRLEADVAALCAAGLPE